MADETSEPPKVTAEEWHTFADNVSGKRQEHITALAIAETARKIGSLENAHDETQKRLAAIRATEAAAKVDLANVRADIELAKQNATTQANAILLRATEDAEQLKAKARTDVQAELADTTAALEAARSELAIVNSRLEKARAALSG